MIPIYMCRLCAENYIHISKVFERSFQTIAPQSFRIKGKANKVNQIHSVRKSNTIEIQSVGSTQTQGVRNLQRNISLKLFLGRCGDAVKVYALHSATLVLVVFTVSL